MPRKIRQLKADLRSAGFVESSERGKGTVRVILSGHDGADVKPYQEREVREAIAQVTSTD